MTGFLLFSSKFYHARKSFVCPCHDSKFAPDGKMLGGPATVALQTYIAKLEGGDVLVIRNTATRKQAT
ncbi:ubiquinol-cytochrome c reductase iron-sulfur subunit [Nostoc sp. CCY0012]|uniref:QcrA and Rieske domain-containing protein n=1 Tax=Nostoc sp. CCY0012 TaxID=1056123 RepID=UPI0039C6F15B